MASALLPEKIERINSEVFTLTYGALVTQLIKDYEDLSEVNGQLRQIGYNIGVRLVDEFLAKSGAMRCKNFRETARTIAKVAFKMYLGFAADLDGWNKDYTSCIMRIPDNALTDFVELPEECKELSYANMICGVIQGSLKMVEIEVDCDFVKDKLHGDTTNEIRLTLKRGFGKSS